MKVIEISSLTKYYGKSKGIENVNLDVNEGDIFGFIGPNGAGKSTTIRTLLNIIFPTSGG
ncbi:MAG: ATP-binding cassette domain-containing protein, partial [Clostridiales bacterium]|nr:ATP-binding cassette domain-containing protein [Clostridiales bacterium]